jgi:hypothetical protein
MAEERNPVSERNYASERIHEFNVVERLMAQPYKLNSFVFF